MPPVSKGATVTLSAGGSNVGRIVHRRAGPGEARHELEIVLGADAPSGLFKVELANESGHRVHFDAWVARDDGRHDLSRFDPLDEDRSRSLDPLACGRRTIVVSCRRPGPPVAAATPEPGGRPIVEVSHPPAPALAAAHVAGLVARVLQAAEAPLTSDEICRALLDVLPQTGSADDARDAVTWRR